MRKHVFGASNIEVRHKSDCASTDASQSPDLDLESRDILLFRQQKP